MVDLSLTCFAIPRAVVVSFDTITIEIVVVRENAQDLYRDGHGVRVFAESEHTFPTTQKHFQSKDMTRDFACSPTIRSIRRALIRLLEVHHLKMASLLKSLKQHAIKVFEQDSICLLVPSYFARHVPRHHTADSYLQLWSFFPHWAYLEYYLSWHVVKFTFTATLPREEVNFTATLPREEDNLQVHFKGFLEFLK